MREVHAGATPVTGPGVRRLAGALRIGVGTLLPSNHASRCTDWEQCGRSLGPAHSPGPAKENLMIDVSYQGRVAIVRMNYGKANALDGQLRPVLFVILRTFLIGAV